MNTLLFSTYRLSSKHIHTIEKRIKYFGKEGNNYFFTTNQTTRLIDKFNLKHNTNYKQISIDKKFFDYRYWSDIEDNIDYEQFKDIDRIVIVGGILHKTAKIDKIFTGKNLLGAVIMQYIINIYICLRVSQKYNIPIIHDLVDPQERQFEEIPMFKDINIKKYFGYDIPRMNLNRLDILQQVYKDESTRISNEKLYDFTFGYTVLTEDRIPPNDINSLFGKFNNPNIYCKNTLTGHNNFVEYDKYIDMISKSKFTLIIPAYDKSSMSFYRMLEALNVDCLPLIHHECFTAELEKSFNIDDIRDIIINIDYEIPSEEKRLELLKKYKDIFLTPKFLL